MSDLRIPEDMHRKQQLDDAGSAPSFFDAALNLLMKLGVGVVAGGAIVVAVAASGNISGRYSIDISRVSVAANDYLHTIVDGRGHLSVSKTALVKSAERGTIYNGDAIPIQTRSPSLQIKQDDGPAKQERKSEEIIASRAAFAAALTEDPKPTAADFRIARKQCNDLGLCGLLNRYRLTGPEQWTPEESCAANVHSRFGGRWADKYDPKIVVEKTVQIITDVIMPSDPYSKYRGRQYHEMFLVVTKSENGRAIHIDRIGLDCVVDDNYNVLGIENLKFS